MREEKRSEIIHDALSFLDDEMIEEVDELRGSGNPVKKTSVKEQKETTVHKRFPWKRWAVLAASICLVIGISSIWSGLNPESNYDTESAGENYFNNSDIGESLPGEENDNVDTQPETDEKDAVNDLGTNDGKEVLGSEIELTETVEVYFGEKLVSGDALELVWKFIDSYNGGHICHVDISPADWAEKEANADGHIYLKYQSGATAHLILLGDGTVCDEQDPSVWVQMDTRIYNSVLAILNEES